MLSRSLPRARYCNRETSITPIADVARVLRHERDRRRLYCPTVAIAWIRSRDRRERAAPDALTIAFVEGVKHTDERFRDRVLIRAGGRGRALGRVSDGGLAGRRTRPAAADARRPASLSPNPGPRPSPRAYAIDRFCTPWAVPAFGDERDSATAFGSDDRCGDAAYVLCDATPGIETTDVIAAVLSEDRGKGLVRLVGRVKGRRNPQDAIALRRRSRGVLLGRRRSSGPGSRRGVDAPRYEAAPTEETRLR